MRICTDCVLDDRFPGIHFDEHGVCNYCRTQQKHDRSEEQRRRYARQFQDLADARRGTSTYDCLVAYSGGKDSTYTLHLLKHDYGFRILAYSFDNWYQSEAAARNIKTVLRNLSIDHLTVRPGYDVMRAVIRASISRTLHSVPALTRASSVCTSCIALIRFAGLKLAIEKRIPFIVFGFSPGQAPMATSLVKTHPGMVRMMQKTLLDRLVEQVGDGVRSLFLQERHFQEGEAFPYSVNPLVFTEYDEARIYEAAAGYGWQRPADTDANSTNCLLNAFANHVHIQHFGFNPYAYELAELVRSGRIERAEGLSRLASPQPRDHILAIEKSLGVIDAAP